MEVDEVNEHGNVQHRSVLSSYEDAYTAELKELYDVLMNGRKIKSSVGDARKELLIYDMMYKSWAAGQ